MMALLLNANDSVSRSYSITKPSPLHPIVPSGCGERTENLFDVKLEQGGWTGSNWSKVYKKGSADTVFYPKRVGSTSIILIDNLEKTYTISVFPSNMRIACKKVDASEIQTSDSGWSVDNTLIITGAYGICITIRKADDTALSVSEVQGVMITEGSTAPASYTPYGYKLPLTSGDTPVDIYIGDDTLSTEEYVDSGTGKIYRRPNLYDTNATDTSKGYLSGSYLYGNNIGSNPNWFVSEYMPILADTDYIASGLVDVGTSMVIATINVYNSNKQVERYETINSFGDTEINSGVNGAFIRISARNEHKNTVVVKPKNAAPVDPPAPLPQIPTFAGTTIIDYAGEGLAPSQFDSIQEWVDKQTYTRVNGEWVAE